MASGLGLADEINDSRLWVNQLCNKIFDNPVITNLADGGRNNHWIFTETASRMTQQDFDIVIVAWSSFARFNFNVGLETYRTLTRLANNIDVGINPNNTISGKWLDQIGDKLRRIHNDHWDILDLIKYTNILAQLNTTSRLFFVNTLFDLPATYFNHIDFKLPSELDSYTLELLQADTRSDDQIKELYNHIHAQYKSYGGMRSELWLNLHKSFYSMKIDDASETDQHPGYASQDRFVEYLATLLMEKLK